MPLETIKVEEVDDPKLPLANIAKPTNLDVLCGRGVARNRHVGNENFRALVKRQKRTYLCSTKAAKMKISRAIVKTVRSQKGRFLEQNVENFLWFDIGDKKAMEKTSQALRDGAAPLRRQLAAMKDQRNVKAPIKHNLAISPKAKRPKWRREVTNERIRAGNEMNVKSDVDVALDTSAMDINHFAKNVSRASSPGQYKSSSTPPNVEHCSSSIFSQGPTIPLAKPMVVSPTSNTVSDESSSPFYSFQRNCWVTQLPKGPCVYHSNIICNDSTAKSQEIPKHSCDFQVRPPFLPSNSMPHQVPMVQRPENILSSSQLQQKQQSLPPLRPYESIHIPIGHSQIQRQENVRMQNKHIYCESGAQSTKFGSGFFHGYHNGIEDYQDPEPPFPVFRPINETALTNEMQSEANKKVQLEFDDLSPLPYKEEEETFYSEVSDGFDSKNRFWLKLIQSPLIED